MKKVFHKVIEFGSNRYLILCIVVALVAILYIGQLFNLQIINGKEYREQSEKRMLRNETVVAARGEMYDRNGIVLATSKLSFDVDLYKVKVDSKMQNDAILSLIHILESNGDKIYSTFPINEELTDFHFSNEKEAKKWKKEMNFEEDATFDEIINEYIKKYGLASYEDRKEQIKMIEVKYEANLNGYSLFNSSTIAKDISQKSVAMIEEAKSTLYGVNVVSVPKRYYPNGTFAAHVIGYVSKVGSEEYKILKEEGYNINSVIGKTGTEQTLERYLRGTDGMLKVETDSMGNVTSETTSKEPVAGNNVTLTIDYRLQKVAEESLENALIGLRDGSLVGKTFSDAESGCVVVLDVKTGEVLALANYPSYDINLFVNGISLKDWNTLQNDPLHPMLNRVISGQYSPGSTYKMLVGLAGLKTGKITVSELYKDPGIYPYGHKPKCWLYANYGRTHGYINISGAIKGSCNCYFYEVGNRIGIQEIVNYAKTFGLGSKTGIELTGEAKGSIAGDNPDHEWQYGETLSAAIGQSSNSYTPIQLANYISALANGGNLNKLTLIKSVKNDNQNTSVLRKEIDEYTKTFTGVDFEARHIDIETEYINAIKEGMLSVTSEVGGTGYITFKNSNIQVAGKTGTAEVPSGSNNGIFVGFAPYDNPQIAVVAITEHGGEGSYTAKVVKPIMEEYFNITQENKANEKEQNVVENKIEF